MKRYILYFLLFSVIFGIVFIFSKNLISPKDNAKTSETKKEKNTLTIKGSDTEVQMVSSLVEAFSNENPDIKISVTGGGSGVGIASLLNKEIDIANSSRKITDEELQQGKDRNLNIREFIVARDGLSIIVNPANPVKQLTIEQLGNIYKGTVTNWKEVGGKNEKISLYGRQSTSGTYKFFRDTVVKADYDKSMLNMEGNQQIIEAIKSDKNGIGYVGVGYVKGTDGQPKKEIKILSVAKDAGSGPVSPLDLEAVKQEKYPIFRPIYQYLSNIPAKSSATAKFLEFEFSKKGEELIQKEGFYPITQKDYSEDQQFFKNMK